MTVAMTTNHVGCDVLCWQCVVVGTEDVKGLSGVVKEIPEIEQIEVGEFPAWRGQSHHAGGKLCWIGSLIRERGEGRGAQLTL